MNLIYFRFKMKTFSSVEFYNENVQVDKVGISTHVQSQSQIAGRNWNIR